MQKEQDPVYARFISRLVKNRLVYSLEDNEGFFAECPSEEYDDDLGEPVAVYCFWDAPNAALQCQQDEWEDYSLATLSLDEFMVNVLLDMDEDLKLVGVSFDAQLIGMEIEPIELLADLLDEIVVQGLALEFEDFDELQGYRQEWEREMQVPTVIH